MNAIGFKNENPDVNLDNVSLDNVNLDNVNTAPEEVALSGGDDDVKPDVVGLKRLVSFVIGGGILAAAAFVLGRLTGKDPVKQYVVCLAQVNDLREKMEKAEGKKAEKLAKKLEKAKAEAEKVKAKAELFLKKMPRGVLQDLLAAAGVQPATIVNLDSTSKTSDATPSNSTNNSTDSMIKAILDRLAGVEAAADRAAAAAASTAEAAASTAEAAASTAEAVAEGFARTSADLAEVKDLTAKAASNADKARSAAERAALAKAGGVDISAIEKVLADLGGRIDLLAATPVAVDDRSAYFAGLKSGLDAQTNQLTTLIREVTAVKARLLDSNQGQGNNNDEARRLRQQVQDLQAQAAALKLAVEKAEEQARKAEKKIEEEKAKAEESYARVRRAEAEVRELTKAKAEPKTSPKAEEPKAEEPKAEEPKAEESKKTNNKKK